MAMKKIMKKKEASLPVSILIGLAVSVMTALLGAGVLAYLISNETLQAGAIGAGSVIIHLFGAAGGGLMAFRVIKRQRIMVCGISVLCYILVLLGMTALIFGGQYQGIGPGILAVIGGGILAILPGFLMGDRRKKRPKIKAFR